METEIEQQEETSFSNTETNGIKHSFFTLLVMLKCMSLLTDVLCNSNGSVVETVLSAQILENSFFFLIQIFPFFTVKCVCAIVKDLSHI